MVLKMLKLINPANNLPLRVAKGHFATRHSHNNYYIDLTMTKHRLSEARAAARDLAQNFTASTVVDTILCLDGMEVVGACMASELTRAGFTSINAHQTIYVLTPESVAGNQLIFRENAVPMVTGKHVLILVASLVTGYTAQEAANVIRYYGGIPVGICTLFSLVDHCAGFPVTACFPSSMLPDYESQPAVECPQCKAGVKLDALVNAHGISSF